MKLSHCAYLFFFALNPLLAIGQSYFWDNQQGLILGTNCVVEQLRETPFRISSYTGRERSMIENLRNIHGVRQSHLITGSVLKIIDGTKKSGYEYVEVLGVNLEQRNREHRWYSERSDRGYLFNLSLKPIEDFYIVLNKGHEKAEGLEYSIWNVPRGEHYLGLNCQEMSDDREYLLFQVKLEDQEDPIFVGVSAQETDIFRQLVTQERNNHANAEDVIEDILSIFNDLRINDEPTDDKPFGVSQRSPAPETYILELLEDMVLESGEESGEEIDDQEGLHQVVCTNGSTLNVRAENLEDVVFQAAGGERVLIYQGFEQNIKTHTIDNQEFEFVEVTFPSRESEDRNSGWIASNFIKAESDCPLTQHADIIRGPETTIKNLDDEACCEFPTVERVTHPYTSGMRMFGARRGGGTRSHAAADLYRYRNEPILSVAPGTVVRDVYYFYQGTYALEVVHSGGFVARYGEINRRVPSDVKRGANVTMSQRLGTMGVVNSGCCRPMLHFELYKGDVRGSLSQTRRPFNRRADLMNPTPYLLKWEREKF
jgi:murein DD-endopeptidase MepM/ murein hydrolase activator NlpD